MPRALAICHSRWCALPGQERRVGCVADHGTPEPLAEVRGVPGVIAVTMSEKDPTERARSPDAVRRELPRELPSLQRVSGVDHEPPPILIPKQPDVRDQGVAGDVQVLIDGAHW